MRRKLKLVRNLSGNKVCSVILPGLRRGWGLNDRPYSAYILLGGMQSNFVPYMAGWVIQDTSLLALKARREWMGWYGWNLGGS